ncbi:pilus assembly protein TadG-related protein [Gemmatimonas sp.]|uniref:pilus assembly protein TadG-related protein n=1 Tax=Gemmatimonas sp. TaxID=1962908 RepID=UPI0039837EF1
MRRKQRVGMGRPRRGATLVFVAVFAVALVAMAAFVIDLSRLYVGTNELQTGADAAALRGALQLQYDPAQSPASVTTSFATSNQALNQPVTLAGADVTPVFWNPAGSPKATILNAWTNANAVQVSASRNTGLLFGKLLSEVSPTPQRKSIAWVANITRVACPTPWGFPLISLNEHLYPSGGSVNYAVTPTIYADLDSVLKSTNGPQSLTMIFWPPSHLENGSTKQIPKQIGTDSAFYALASSINEYADQIAAPKSKCFNSIIEIDQSEASGVFPGQGTGSVQKKTVNGVQGDGPANKLPGLCETAGLPSNRADCWPKGTTLFTGQTPGVTVTVAWVGAIAGSNVPVRTIGGFRIMCVYRSAGGGAGGGNGKGNGGNGSGGGGERCEWLDGTNNGFFTSRGVSTPYDEGTIVGYPVTTYPGLGNGVVLGNAPSLAQRLILVR